MPLPKMLGEGEAALEGQRYQEAISDFFSSFPPSRIESWVQTCSQKQQKLEKLLNNDLYDTLEPQLELYLYAYSTFFGLQRASSAREFAELVNYDVSVWESNFLNSKILSNMLEIDFLDYFMYNFAAFCPEFGLEFHNMSSVLKSSGKCFKQLFGLQLEGILGQMFQCKSEVQFVILDVKCQIDNLTEEISHFTDDFCALKAELLELIQLLCISKVFLRCIEGAFLNNVDVSSIDVTPLIEILLENLSFFVLFPTDRHIEQFDTIVEQFAKVSELSSDILLNASKLESSNIFKPKIEYDSPQESRRMEFQCRKCVIQQFLETFCTILKCFSGQQHLVEFMMLLASHFSTLVNQMKIMEEWKTVSKQDKEGFKNTFCNTCGIVKNLCLQDCSKFYFPIISFFDLALALFNSHIIFLDRLFMDILIQVVFESKESGLVQKAGSIVYILFNEPCAVSYARTHYSLMIGQENYHPSSVIDMVYALEGIVII